MTKRTGSPAAELIVTTSRPVTAPVESSAASPARNREWKRPRRECALEVVDSLLRTPGAVTGEEADLLLDLRSLLCRRVEAATAIRIFCDLRRRLERSQYLAFFRLRIWLERHLQAEVRLCPAAESVTVEVKLQFYCPEAIRRAT
ncbi:MAG TPA: hypothetical protein PLX89_20180, partial [Verrucomicrobiota bacterium]|nr:hypothetical protein [Verrucomicrobiota bacterium]